MQFRKETLFWLTQEILVGVTVSAVALSLGGAFGALSGRGVVFGMLAAAVYPLITSSIGGTKIQCSGPTGPMTTMYIAMTAAAAASLAEHTTAVQIGFLNMTVFLTGIILLFGGLFRFGKLVTLVPNVIISGFMDGIALIIWISQGKKLFQVGSTIIEGSVLLNCMIALTTILIIVGVSKLVQHSQVKLIRFISGTFIALIIMTIVCWYFNVPVETSGESAPLHSLAELQAFLEGYTPLHWPWQLWLFALPWAFQLAGVAYLDSLLTSRIIDKHTSSTSNPNKELYAQGAATSLIACMGCIPGAQATERSMLIVKEGATSRVSGILVGVFALLGLFVFKDAIATIPKAVFAGILLKLGYDVFDWQPFNMYLGQNKRKKGVQTYHILLILFTAIFSVLTSILVGIVLGSIIFVLLTKKNRKYYYDLTITKTTEGLTDEP